MALIIDPDDLNQSTQAASGTPDGEVYIDTTAKTIELISSTDGYAGSNLIAADGVTGQCLYSFLKEEWKSDTNLIKFPFPMEAITGEQFEFINDWKLTDTTTASRSYVRSAGWAEKEADGTLNREYMSVITLGTFVGTPTAYYFWEGDAAKTDFTYSGPVNEAVQIYGDATNGNFDNRSAVLTVAIRPDTTGGSGSVEGYTFDQSTTTDIGASTVTYQAYRFPLSSVVDLDLTLTDAEIGTLETNKSLTLTWYATPQASDTFLPFDLSGGPYNFEIIVNGNGTVTTSEFYNWVQWSLRQDADIDDGAGTQNGYLTPALMEFVGSSLQTFDIDSTSSVLGGVAIDGFDTNFTNDIKMRDNTGALRQFDYVAAGKLLFNTNAIEDAATYYQMFYTNDDAGDNLGNDYGTSGAITVQDNSSQDIKGDLHNVQATQTGDMTGTTGSTTQSSAVFTATTPGWVADELIGKVLKIHEGGGNPVDGHYWIIDNDTTTITVDRQFESTESALDFTIYDKNTAGEIVWDYNYTNNVQRGTGSDNTDAPVTIVAIGLDSAQYVVASATILEATGQNFSLTAALERNYNDPVPGT